MSSLPLQPISDSMKGAVRRFTVIFDEGKLKSGKAHAGGLYAQMLANITALAGEAKSVSPSGGKTFRLTPDGIE